VKKYISLLQKVTNFFIAAKNKNFFAIIKNICARWNLTNQNTMRKGATVP
jgi:hypothetical protein